MKPTYYRYTIMFTTAFITCTPETTKQSQQVQQAQQEPKQETAPATQPPKPKTELSWPQAIVNGIRCFMAHWQAGTDVVPFAAHYYRHNINGVCILYKGAYTQEIPSHECPYHTNTNIQSLLESCGRAVSFHTAEGNVVAVESDATPVQRGQLGGPHLARLAAKPRAHKAALWTCTTLKSRMLSFYDEHDKPLVIFECNGPLQEQRETSWFGFVSATHYVLDETIMRAASKYTDARGLTLVDLDPSKDGQCQNYVPEMVWRSPKWQPTLPSRDEVKSSTADFQKN